MTIDKFKALLDDCATISNSVDDEEGRDALLKLKAALGKDDILKHRVLQIIKSV